MGTLDLPLELSCDNYVLTYKDVFKKANRYRAAKSAPMAIIGSTKFPTHLEYSLEREFVPRLNLKSKPGKSGWEVMQRPWFKALTKKAEDVVLSHLERHDRHSLAKVLMFKRVAPEELRLCGSVFHALALVGDLSNGHNHAHVDKHDVCSVIIMLGKDILGGSTLYYDSEGKEVVHSEAFSHGKYQVGPFHEVKHAGQHWKGPRGILSFYTNRSMVEHFFKYGTELIEKWSETRNESLKVVN